VAKPKVLFVTEKWAECDPTHALSNAHHNFIGSLFTTGLAESAVFHFDEWVLLSHERCDQALIDTCREEKPDLLFLTMVRGTDVNPKAETLATIRDELGVKIASMYGDTFDRDAIDWIESYAYAVDANVVQDCYSVFEKLAPDTSKYIATWTPQDPRLYYNAPPDTPRPYDVGFAGSIARYPERKLYLGLLAENGINVSQAGGQSEDYLSVEDYAGFLRASKIALNFSQPILNDPTFHCKGRTIEATLCGALLMEQRNPETERWFTPGKDYADYADERELVDKCRYYLEHEDERAEIAASGHEKASRLYSADAYWRMIFERLLPGFKF